jgi:hypothetical protein
MVKITELFAGKLLFCVLADGVAVAVFCFG